MQKNNENKKRMTLKERILLTIILTFLAIFLFIILSTKRANHYLTSEIVNFNELESISIEVPFSEFEKQLNEGNVKFVFAEFSDEEYSNTMFYALSDMQTLFLTQNPLSDNFKLELLQSGVDVQIKAKAFDITSIPPRTKNSPAMSLISLLLNILIAFSPLILFYFLFMKNSALSGLDKEDVKAPDPTHENNGPQSFDDVGGLHELKTDLKAVVDFVKNPQNYQDAGAKLPRGILLVGPPGTGKTMLAKVIAKEAGVNFLYKNGSDFVEMYVGKGAQRVRKLFAEARKQAPCIIFIDEIDTLCGKRGIERGEHSEDRKTLTALLAEMDGFKTSENILVIGATNRVEDIDAAALRPGRFTDVYTVPIPQTLEERLEIIKLYTKNKKISSDFDEKQFAKEMIGRSPAEIEAVLNEAAIVSVKNGLGYITNECIEEAFYKRVMKGHKKSSSETNPEDLKVIAYHEAGHALIAKLVGNAVNKVTIAPSTSGAGGVTFTQPSERKLYTKEMLENKVMELYGGKVAEYLLAEENWDKTTTGCSNDIEQATNILKDMVDSYGMSSNSLVNLNMLNRETTDKSANYIVELSSSLRDKTVALMKNNYNTLEKIANALLEFETINEQQLEEIIEKSE